MTPEIVAANRTPSRQELNLSGEGHFRIVTKKHPNLERILRLDEYSAAEAFVNGDLIVEGDLGGAIRFFRERDISLFRRLWSWLAAGFTQFRSSLLTSRAAAARNIRFHYDRSNDFYYQFLDSRMLYSAADFNGTTCTLEEAQTRKLDEICQTLGLKPNEWLLDVGCGWGALVVHAAERFGVNAIGCTLSRQQLEFARSVIKDHGLERCVTIQETDYRDLQGRYDKIASIGMFEHVGRRHLREYFRKIHSLLEDGGIFLNRGIVRPETTSVGPATLFLQRKVFPGGELVHLSEVMREAELAGFETVEMCDLRQNYALTCRAWVARLVEHAGTCRSLVDEATYRTWLLYLAASAISFEDGVTDAVQVTFRKRTNLQASKDGAGCRPKTVSTQWR